MLNREDFIDEELEKEWEEMKTNEIQQMTKYKELSRELNDIAKGRWQFVFHYGSLEVWDKMTRESIFIYQKDLPVFKEIINFLESK